MFHPKVRLKYNFAVLPSHLLLSLLLLSPFDVLRCFNQSFRRNYNFFVLPSDLSLSLLLVVYVYGEALVTQREARGHF